jgi:hypothetical protein
VQGEGYGVKVALGQDAGGGDEIPEGVGGDRFLIEVGSEADRFQVGVDDRIRFRQQPCDIRRSLLAEVQNRPERAQQGEDGEQCGC